MTDNNFFLSIIGGLLTFLGIAIPAYLNFVTKRKQQKFDLQQELEEYIEKQKKQIKELEEENNKLKAEMTKKDETIINQTNQIEIMNSEAANAIRELEEKVLDFLAKKTKELQTQFNIQ